MSRSDATRAPETSWSGETLRLSLFYSPVTELRVNGWWEHVVGQAPDSSTNKPKSGEVVEIGNVDDAQLVLQSQPRAGRVDWIMQAAAGELSEQSPSLFPVMSASFINRMTRFLKVPGIPPLNRMAFGAVVLLPVTDPEQGYRTLSDYLPFDIDRTNSSDFLYQINRLRSSKNLSDLKINRLMKWSVGLSQRSSFAIDAQKLMAVATHETVAVNCRIELDINTVFAADRSLPNDRLESLMMELQELAREIVQEGDIP